MFTVTTEWWWISTILQHQTYPFHTITQTSSSLWLQHGGESLLHCTIRLTHFTDNINHVHCDYRMVVNVYYTATSDLPISQITPTSSLWLQDRGESLLHCNIRLTHFTDNTRHTSLGLQDGGEPLLEFNNRLKQLTDNTNQLHCDYRMVVNLYYTITSDLPISQITPDIFTVTTGWWWMSTTLQHQTYPFHR